MSSIPPVPNTRITGLLARQRLTAQYQNDQLDLFRLQEQISTGLRISLPSQDAPAALRAISFKHLLTRKDQLGSNINSGALNLASAENALGGEYGIADTLNRIKSETLGVIGTVTTSEQRETAIIQINDALKALVGLGNRQANGRYLFSGSQTGVQPFSLEDGHVVYHGDDAEIKNYSDIGVLFSSNISGQDVFGGVSAEVLGTADLAPPLSADTLLSSLRGGRGITPNGSLEISDVTANSSATVDLSRASTIGDVAKLIEDGSPEGSRVEVAITSAGLEITLASGNALAIAEVGTGTTAREFGILGTGSPATIVSEDLDPQLQKTTRLEHLLGTKARAVLVSGGGDDNNDIFLEASTNGVALDGVTIQVIDGGNIGDNVGVVYNGGTKTLTISVDDEEGTNANRVIEAINAEGTFRAQLDRGDTSELDVAGTGPVWFGATAVTSGGSGETLDQSSGLRIVSGEDTFDIVFDGDETVEDLLNRLNQSEADVHAEINAAGTGIDIRSRRNGTDFQIGEINGGTTATQLGVRTYGRDTKLADFNHGIGVPTKDAYEFHLSHSQVEFTTSDGSSFDVDLVGGADATDAVNSINASIGNTGLVTAQLSGDGKRIEFVDHTVGTGRLTYNESGPPITALPEGLDLTIPAIDFNITAQDGTELAIDLSGAATVGDVLDRITNAAGNGGKVTAQLADSGNGIELIDNTGGGGPLRVTSLEGGNAAEYLGLVAKGETETTSVTDRLTGSDRHALETESVFNTLVRLRDALKVDDLAETTRAGAQLNEDLDRVTFARAEVGTRLRSLDLAKASLADEEIQLKSALSEEIDVDLIEAISQMTARQTSLEASLRATANILQLSLLNFI